MIHAGILAPPEAGLHRGVVGLLEPRVERGIDVREPPQVDVVGELVDQDVLGGVGVAGIAEHVLLPAGAERIRLAAPQAAGPGVPVVLRRQAGEARHRIGRKPAKLRLVRRVLVPADDAEPGTAFDHGLADIRAFRQQQVDQVDGLLQGVGIDGRGRDHRIASRGRPLGVDRRDACGVGEVEPHCLHTLLRGDRDLLAVPLAGDREPVAERGVDRRLLAGRDGVGQDLGPVVLEPEDLGGLVAAVDHLQAGPRRGVVARGGRREPGQHEHARHCPGRRSRHEWLLHR